MASTKEYRDYIIDQLNILDNITYKPMMGEYLLYYNNILFGGIYDDRLLIKKTNSNKKYNLQEDIPYNGAKTMYLIDNVEDKDTIRDIIIDTYNKLKDNNEKNRN